jgi:hypothetical protein
MLQPNYIASLLAEHHIDGLIAARPDPTASGAATSLLQTLLVMPSCASSRMRPRSSPAADPARVCPRFCAIRN